MANLYSSPLWGGGGRVKKRGLFPVPEETPGMLKRSPGMSPNLDVNKNECVGLKFSGLWELREQGVGEGRSSQGRLPGGRDSGWLYRS